MQCPACEADWPDEIRYCGECGGRMPDATVVASPYKIQVEASDTPHALPSLIDRNVPVPEPTPSDEGDPEVSAPVPLEIDVRGGNVGNASQLLLAPDPPTLASVQHVDLSAIEEAWRLVSARKGNLAVGTLVVGLAMVALAATGIGAFALGPLYGGLAIVGLRVASGRTVAVTDFFDGFIVMTPLLLLGLLTALIIALGSIALVIPGLYLAIASVYAPFLVVDRGDAPWPALRTSMDAVNARLGDHLGFVCVLASLNTAGALLCGFGLLLTVPLSVVSLAVCYGRLFGFSQEEHACVAPRSSAPSDPRANPPRPSRRSSSRGWTSRG